MVVGPVVSTEVEINTGDPVEAGPAMEEPPLEVISEARVEKNGKTFFVLETQVAQPDNQTQQGDNMFRLVNSTQDLPLQPKTPKKVKKGRKKEKR